MKIEVLCAGKIKEAYFRDAIAEYRKRLSRYCTLTITEVADGPDPVHEGDRMLPRIREDAYVIALEIKGSRLSSEGLAEKMGSLMVRGISHVIFVIGGSDGLDPRVTGLADESLSFSDMTFPHQLMRLILLEQVYRSFRILRKEPYHK